MYCVVSGAGEVGAHVARTLREEGHEVAVLEADPKMLRRIEGLDALLIEGSGASLDRLNDAQIKRADIYIGATGDDEVNMVGAAIAKTFGAKTIARVNDPAYVDEAFSTRFRRIGVDVVVCPELVAAEKVSRILATPGLLSVDVFAENRVHVGEIQVAPTAGAVGKKVKDLALPRGINLLVAHHEGDANVVHGGTVLAAEDRLLVAMTRPESIFELEGLLGRPRVMGGGDGPIANVMVAGATRVGLHLCRILEKTRHVVLLDENEERCRKATETLDKTLVINGNATDRHVLVEEDAASMDAFVGTHAVEEYNILACLVAKSLGVRRTLAMINQPELRDLVEKTGIDVAINAKQATVGAMLRHVHKTEAMDLVVTRGGEAQLLELRVRDDSKVAGKSLQKAGLPREAVCAAIVRGQEVILPRGTDLLLPGDRVVLYVKPEEIPRIEELF